MNLNLFLLIVFLTFYMSCPSKETKNAVLVENKTAVQSEIALAKPAFQHTLAQGIQEVAFDSILSNRTPITYLGLSQWIKICFDSVPGPIVLDFINHYEITGYNQNCQKQPRMSAEFYPSSATHERHFAFEIPLSKTPQIFYFKVYSLTLYKTDTLKWCIEKATDFQNKMNQYASEARPIFGWYMFIVGVALFQLIYILSLAWSRRQSEYWYYLGFTLMGIAYVTSVRRYEMGLGESPWVIPSAILSHIAVVTFFYSRFVRSYLNTPRLNKTLDFQLQILESVLILGVLVNISIYLVTGDIEYASRFHESFDTLVKVLNIYFIFFFYAQRSVLVYYLLAGLATMVLSALLIFGFEWGYEHHYFATPLGENSASLLATIGSVFDAACLNLGLNYKHRLEVVAQQNAVETMRNTIASDLHDDLGAGLSTIRLLGERAQIGIENKDKKRQIQKMTTEASDLIQKMSTVIWAMNSRNDTLESLIAYMRHYALEYCESMDLSCHFVLPELPPSVSKALLTGNARRQIFLTVKEALHNIVKHADGTDVQMPILFKTEILRIEIADNGKGCEGESLLGNGLKNMKARIESIGGRFSIQSEKGKGTTIIIEIKINKS